jgi:phage gpG-like protein
MSAEIKIEIPQEALDLARRAGKAPVLAAQKAVAVIDRQNELTVAAIQRDRLTARAAKVFEDNAGKSGKKQTSRRKWQTWRLSPLSGKQALHVRSNRLRSSINRNAAVISGDQITSSIGSNVRYAAIHEYGGQTAPHAIRVRSAKSLAFRFGGKLTFRRSVRHPGSKIPARPYIRPTLEERAPEYGKALGAALVEALGIKP